MVSTNHYSENAHRVLITGASGFIGGRLKSPGSRLLLRKSIGAANEVIGDLDNIESLHRACEDIDLVLHCAGYAHAFSVSDPSIHWRTNFEGTRNLVESAARSGVRRFVFLSSVKAMAEPGNSCADETWPGTPTTPYGQAKRAAENIVLETAEKHGMEAVILRLSMVYGAGSHGNLERMVNGIRAGWFPPVPETGNKRSLVHVNDVIDAIHLVSHRTEAAGQIYIVADQRAYSTREIYDAIRLALGLPAIKWGIPSTLLRAGGKVGDFCKTLGVSALPLNSETVDRLLDSAWYSPNKMWQELGWRSKVELVDGIGELRLTSETGNL